MLEPEERANVIDAVVDDVGDEVPIITGVDAPSTHDTSLTRITQLKTARKRSSWVSRTTIRSPARRPSTTASESADAVSISAYIYYFPARVENTLELDTLDRFASTERTVDVEEPSGDAGQLWQAINGTRELISLAGIEHPDRSGSGALRSVTRESPRPKTGEKARLAVGSDRRSRET